MKKLLLIILVLTACMQLSQALASDSLRIQDAINQVQKKYAPDKRTAIFKVDTVSTQPLVLHLESTEKGAVAEFKQLLKDAGIDASIDVNLLPSQNLNGFTYGLANLSVVNNRFSPGHDAELVTQALLGTPVQVLKKERGYYLVRTPDRYISWVDDAGVVPMNEKAFERWQMAERIVITSGSSRSYSQPSKKSLPVSDVVSGNILELIGKKKRFYQVRYPDNRVAFVHKRDAELFSKWLARPNPGAKDILSTAKSLIGVPYLWGGTSVKGMDCSGFTKTCFFLNRIILPRDASQQVFCGKAVDIKENDTVSIAKGLKNLQPGDLLFFAAGKNKRPDPRITHTAIYMGEGKFIQAAGMVRINSLLKDAPDYDDFQTRTLVGARRILNSVGSEGLSRIDKHPYYTSLIN